MIDTQKTIERAKIILGAPICNIELTDEQMAYLIDDAYDAFNLFSEIADLPTNKYHRIQKYWISKYFYALCKETLARIRGKFEGKLAVPGTDLKLDYESLQNESEKEKRLLRHLILQEKDVNKFNEIILVFYINIGNMSSSDVESFMRDVQKKLKGSDDFIKYFIPINEGETRIECINSSEPNPVNEETISKLNTYLQKLIEDEK